jgi:hypothetical protein
LAQSIPQLRAKGLFKSDAIFGTVFDGLMDVFAGIIIQGKNLHIAGVINLKCMGSKLDTDLTEDTAS